MLPSSSAVPPPPASASASAPALAAAAASVDALTQRGIAAVAALLSVADTLGSRALAAEPTPAALAALAAEIRSHADGVLDATWQVRSLARAWRGGGGGGGGG